MTRCSEGKFMVAVAAVIEHSGSGDVLIIKKPCNSEILPGTWEISTGLLNQFEMPEMGLIREVGEETGLRIRIVKPLRTFHFYRGKKKAETEMVGFTYWCRAGTKKVRISKEHTEFKWVSPKEALRLVKTAGIREDIRTFLRERDAAGIGK